jgi:hypothetical protein
MEQRHTGEADTFTANTEILLSCIKQPTTSHFSEPDKSTPRAPIPFYQIHFNIT